MHYDIKSQTLLFIHIAQKKRYDLIYRRFRPQKMVADGERFVDG